MNRIDWPALLKVGLEGLRLRPDEFWALTPAELRMMLGNDSRPGPLLSAGLETLMAAYPDKTEKDGSYDHRQ